MRPQDRLLFKVVSVLLRFPDEDVIDSLPSVGAALEGCSLGARIERCHEFVDYLETHPLVQLQEEFSRIFDLSPETCLNMTYHRYGESRERGSALAGLTWLYRNAGYELLGSELPDYLPLILEFLSICDEDAGLKIIKDWADQVEKLTHDLKKTESPYAALLEILWEVFTVSEHPGRQVGHG
jgi:nitrate reductase molybdenum cofactor assembly chaperone NarJ/NarW